MEHYDNYWHRRSSSGNRYRYDIFLHWVTPGSSVLDAGCGDGFLGGRLIAERHSAVTGMDVSDVALTRAQERGITTVRGSLDQPLPFGDGSFDYVIASESLEHIIHSEDALKELFRIARRAVIISVPNSAFWRYRWQVLTGRFMKQWLVHPWEHVRFWSLSDFQTMLHRLYMHATIIRAGSGRRFLRDWWPAMFAEQVCYYIPKK